MTTVNLFCLLVLLLETTRQKAGQTGLSRYAMGKIKKKNYKLLMIVLMRARTRKFYIFLSSLTASS